jgi:hypothetical protein
MRDLNFTEQTMLWGVIVVAFISLAYAYWLWLDTARRDKGNEAMQRVWLAIKVGANAYLQRQLRTILPILALLAVALFFSVYVVGTAVDRHWAHAGVCSRRFLLHYRRTTRDARGDRGQHSRRGHGRQGEL